LEVQRRIAEILSTLDEAIEQTEALIAKMQQVKAGLMHDLFTRGITPDGRLRPTREQVPELYKESPIGWIPREWDCEEIGSLAQYYNGNSFPALQWRSEGFPIIRIQNLNGEADFNFYNGPLEESWTVRPGDLLFAWAGMRETSFGPRIWTGPMGVLNQHIFKVVVNCQKIESSTFFYYMLRYRLPEIVKAAHGFKDSFVHITRKELGGVLVAMPRKGEQSLINVKLQTLDELLIFYSEDFAKLQQKKLGLMQDLLTGRVGVGQSDTFLSNLSAVGAQRG
jgi:type I restriction enzyme S subunit